MSIINDFTCLVCNLQLKNIYIKCKACKFDICLECFSNGRETHTHKSNHDYYVLNLSNIYTFDKWNLADEIDLLKQINETNNLTKFLSIKQPLYTLTSAPPRQIDFNQCLSHVYKWTKMFENDEENNNNNNSRIEVDTNNELVRNMVSMPRDNNINNNSDTILTGSVSNALLPKIRPQLHSKQYRFLSGYKPARGDFETEFNDSFEMKYIADLDYYPHNNKSLLNLDESIDNSDNENLDDSDDLEDELKLLLLKKYNELIQDRIETKRFIKDFGIMYDMGALSNSIAPGSIELVSHMSIVKYIPSSLDSSDNYTHLISSQQQQQQLNIQIPLKLQRLFNNYTEYVKFIELLNYQAYLKKRLDDLNEYRANGVRSLKFVDIYKGLKLKRLNRTCTIHMGSLVTSIHRFQANDTNSLRYDNSIDLNKMQCEEWFKKFVIGEKNLFEKKIISNYSAAHLKYKNNPLKIENYPDADKLDDDEKEFCRVSRVQPSVYLRVKTILIGENTKAGCCSYSRARKIAGIDVNKTRLIHNLLINLGLIKANISSQQQQNQSAAAPINSSLSSHPTGST